MDFKWASYVWWLGLNVVWLQDGSPTIPNVRREVGATLRKARDRAARPLLEGALMGAGIALLLVSCALLVYLGAVLLAQGAEWILVP